MDLDAAKEFLKDECGREVISFFGIPIVKFNKEDLIRMIAIGQKELEEAREQAIRQLSFLSSLRR